MEGNLQSTMKKWIVGAELGLAAFFGYNLLQEHRNRVNEELRARLLLDLTIKSTDEILQVFTPMLQNGPDSIVDEDNSTLLMLACRDGKMDLVQRLLELGASQTIENTFGWRAIHMSTLSGWNSITEVLLKADLACINFANPTNDWTSLHIAASKNNLAGVKLLIEHGVNVNALTNAGHSALIITACNGFFSLSQLLIEAGAEMNVKTSAKRETAFYLACRNGYFDIVKLLMDFKADINSPSVSGSTPLHAACSSGSLEIVSLLLDQGCPLNHKQLDGSTALHIAAFKGNLEIAKLLISKGALLDVTSKYGKTPLHEACYQGHDKMVELFLSKGASLSIPDNDGMSPLHTACSGARDKKGDFIRILDLLIKGGASVNYLDSAQCTPLHVAACSEEKGVPLVKVLLDAGADATLESVQGWSPLRSAYSPNGHPLSVQYMEEKIKATRPEFLETFDSKKPKSTSNRAAIYSRLSEEEKAEVLYHQINLQGIAERIKTGRSKRIIVLTGAGISVNAGIPDFRSPDTGMYSSGTGEKYGLPSPGSAFDPVFIRSNPKPFFAICKDMFLPVIQGKFKPTKTHHFISLLHKKGLLLRNYTQNIDTLELVANIPQDLLVESHGSYNKCYCMECKKPGDISTFWNAISRDEVPACESCHGILRPNVIFFGEPLPARFLDLRTSDFASCDLLIIIGTSLKVYPFAALVNDVSESTPRLLINREAVGPFSLVHEDRNYRDVAQIGDSDDGVAQLAKLLGWELELEQLCN